MRDPRDQFGPVAESYLTSAVHSNPTALQNLIELVHPNGGTVVDVATGAGHTAYAFTPYVDRVIATDITPDMLRVTRDAARERSLNNLAVLFAKAEAMPFATGQIEGVTCRMGAHHFQDAREFVSESSRMLAPKGWFLLVDNMGVEDEEADNQLDLLERIRDPSHVRCYRRSWWRATTASFGLTVIQEEVNAKALDAEDWMERMHVPAQDRDTLRKMLTTATGAFAQYIRPETREGRLWFHFDELTMLCRKS